MSLVSFAVRGNVGIITLNAPKALNALSFEMGREFRTLIDVLSHTLTTPPESLDPIVAETFPPPSSTLELPPGSSGVNAVVLTGSGRAFSAGGSLDFLYSRTGVPPHVNASIMHNFYTNFLAVRSLPVPVVAAVNGAAIGAGACVTLAADYRIAKPSGEGRGGCVFLGGGRRNANAGTPTNTNYPENGRSRGTAYAPTSNAVAAYTHPF